MSFPISEASPVRFAATLPPRADVVVIGGGVIGVMTAWFLRERGLSVVVCEKGRIAGEQSGRNWGWVRQQGRDPCELPIMVESLSIWKRLAAEMGDGLGFRQTGVLYLAQTEAEIERFEAWTEHARAHRLDTRLLATDETMAMLKGAAAPWKGGLFTASDARAEPWVAVPALAAVAETKGVVIREACAVRGLDLAAGQVEGVVTEMGRIACDHVVVAAGAWSRLFLRQHGVSIPQLSVLASVAATEPMPDIFPGNAGDKDFAFRRNANGGLTIAPRSRHDFHIGPDAFASFGVYLPVLKNDFRSTAFHFSAPGGYPDAWRTPRRWSLAEESPFERQRILNPAPNLAMIAKTQDHFAAAFPSIGRPQLRSVWAGMIDSLPDVVPIVDHAGIRGLTIATGMSGHGFGIGPGMGRVVADLVMGNATGHDLNRFRLSRFSDGSPIRPSPSL